MRKKCKRYLLTAILCFCCIFLCKSENMQTAAAAQTDRQASGEEWGDEREEREDEGIAAGKSLRLYVNGKYYAVDVMLLLQVTALLLLMAIEHISRNK